MKDHFQGDSSREEVRTARTAPRKAKGSTKDAYANAAGRGVLFWRV